MVRDEGYAQAQRKGSDMWGLFGGVERAFDQAAERLRSGFTNRRGISVNTAQQFGPRAKTY